MDNIYAKIIESENENIDCALCIITSIKGSTPRKPGSKMLVYSSGKIFGTIGGGSLENQVIKDALETLKIGKPKYFKHNLLEDHSMGCGGNVEIYIEPILKSYDLYIFGAGHIGKALAKQANKLGFKVTVIDERESIFDDFNSEVIRTINKNHNEAFKELQFNKRVFITSITHKHGYDYDVIAHCAKKEFAYLGMIGSKRKIETAKKSYLQNNILTEKEIEKIDWPMGVPITCETPEEIVVSILAKLIDVRGKLNKQN
ncbi:MAG: XdhC family protein [Chlorobi bacterium]|nr:XdhC family protein [Chlorobiota bacterium]